MLDHARQCRYNEAEQLAQFEIRHQRVGHIQYHGKPVALAR